MADNPEDAGIPLTGDLSELLEKLTELEQLAETLSRGKYMWESTFDAIGDPVMIIDENFAILRANLAAAERAGREIRSMIRQPCYEVFAGREGACPLCPLQDTRRRNVPHNTRIDGLMKKRDFQVNSYPYVDPISGNRAVVHHYREVTEEKRLQRKLVQSEKMAAVGLLAGGIAHEINNPLGGILAFAQLIMRDLKEDSPVRSDVLEIENAAIRCKQIVENLLNFSRQSHESEKVAVSVNEMIEKILPLVKLQLRSEQIQLTTDYAKDSLHVLGEMSPLQQVVLNLITNAAHAIPKGGHITVRTRASENRQQVVIEVEDDGAGIPAEDLDRIFDPYYTTKGAGDGTGLGLSICYSIVTEHDGQIEVRSQVGQGSCFTITLPALKVEADVAQVAKGASS